MGMYSYCIEQDIKVHNKEKFKKALAKYKKENPTYNLTGIDEDVDFNEMDGMKIQGYWYDETVDAFNFLAQYMTGWVVFRYEDEEMFRVVFKDEKVYVQEQPVIDWSMAPNMRLNRRVE